MSLIDPWGLGTCTRYPIYPAKDSTEFEKIVNTWGWPYLLGAAPRSPLSNGPSPDPIGINLDPRFPTRSPIGRATPLDLVQVIVYFERTQLWEIDKVIMHYKMLCIYERTDKCGNVVEESIWTEYDETIGTPTRTLRDVTWRFDYKYSQPIMPIDVPF
jgi:hypothetical protein